MFQCVFSCYFSTVRAVDNIYKSQLSNGLCEYNYIHTICLSINMVLVIDDWVYNYF